MIDVSSNYDPEFVESRPTDCPSGLVPFLEKTQKFDAETKVKTGRQMVLTAVVTALILFATGALLMRLLHITGGAVAIAGGIILALLAIKMASGPTGKHEEDLGLPVDPAKIAVFPLAVPYLLNPVGITVVIIASGEVVSIASAGLVVGLILLVGAFDYLVFTNIDALAKRMKPASLSVSEVVTCSPSCPQCCPLTNGLSA